ncbi:MAG: DMT family transporter [Pyrinomonadaceae bacterium]
MIKIIALTAFALAAFAFNSILCRLALRTGEIDPASFTTIRLLSGTVLLIAISYFVNRGSSSTRRGNWISAFFLFAYAICFSFAYLGLTAGTGALVLFGSVQITMIGSSIFRGVWPYRSEWFGLIVAVCGLIYLVLPGLAAPPIFNAALMAVAGIAWGLYTLRGKGSTDPLADTTGNFLRSVPMIVIAALPFLSGVRFSNRGILLAVLSGAVASAIGYTAWYSVLKHHTSTRAAVLQLAVPLITAGLGSAFLSETLGARWLIAAVLILGGIASMIIVKAKPA